MKTVIPGFLVVITSLLLLTSCATIPQQPQTLYDKLGSEAGLASIVDSLIKEIGSDKQIFHYFADSRISRFRTNLTQHLCALADGPCSYDGDSLTDIHTGMHINEKDFNHLVDLLIKAMYSQHIPHPVQNQLLARLAPLRTEVIYK